MKKLFLFLYLISSFSIAQVEKHVFFIGNSYTYSNNLPGLINQIALSKGNQLTYEAHTPGGSTLAQHASNSTVQSILESSEWDYVVLQEQSQAPSFPPYQVETEVYPYAENLCQAIRESSDCAEPIFFMTWGRENGDQQNCQFYPPICTYEGMQNRLIESYTEMAQNNESLLAPIGIAWKNLRQDHPEIDLYSNDGSHPSIQGSYLAACVFYSLIFNDSALNSIVPENMDALNAEIIQTYAFDAIDVTTTDYTSQTQAVATYEFIEDNIIFHNSSLNADSINWVGISQNILSSDDSLIIDISEFTGTYEIMLTAFGNCNSEQHIIINDLKLENLTSDIVLFPNPSSGLLKIETKTTDLKNILIYNTIGDCVLNEPIDNKSTWNLNYLSEGSYQIILRATNDTQYNFNWIKKN